MHHIALKFVALVCFAAGMSVQTLRAQDYRPGYLITNTGDSLSGFISYNAGNKNLARCSFKKTKKSGVTRYTAAELREYGFFGDRQYVSLVLPNKTLEGKVFVRVLAKGPIRLYRYGNQFFVQKDSVLTLPIPEKIQVETEKGNMLRDDKRYVGVMNSLLLDCSLTANESSYAESDLTNLVNNYNRCKGYEPMQKKPKPLAKLNYELFAGYVQSNLEMDLLNGVKFSPSKTIIGGFGLDYSAPRVSDRLFLSVEGWYANALYQAYVEGPYNGDYRRMDILMDVTYFKLPIGFRYNFLKENSTPYIKVGFAPILYQKIDVKTLEEKETSTGIVNTYEYEGGYDLKKSKGVWFSAGYDKLISGRTKLFLEFRYEKGQGYIGTAIQSFSSLDNYNFLLGLRF